MTVRGVDASKMYAQQGQAYDAIVQAVRDQTPAAFFIDGPGGAGKTYLYNALLRFVRGERWIGLACAWSGIAATLLDMGRTCHSRFGLPVPLPPLSVFCFLAFHGMVGSMPTATHSLS